MIVKRNKKNLTHYTWLALLIIPSFYFKSLFFDSLFSLKFDKHKKKIYSKDSIRTFLPSSNIEQIDSYVFQKDFH
ncbi:conserved Plasmodium protein, unknown function [Plasmodium ovale]|uniref:Uncharacterized protein n=1 Tax=Plasmodium ovale TaxID=36330 RepID=A0A1D3TL20_PLAOA|nr:conserved Plasmodium protein, unknown function [Plasmodium ovale]